MTVSNARPLRRQADLRHVRRRSTRQYAIGLITLTTVASLVFGVPAPAVASPADDTRPAIVPAASSIETSNLSFEQGTTGWASTGTVTVLNDGRAQDGTQYLRLSPGASVSQTITGLTQGSYTLAGWFDAAPGNNAAAMSATDTGAPTATSMLDAYLAGAGTWSQGAHRNVLVYNGQVTITFTAGSTALNVDAVTLTLDSEDENPLQNWGLDEGVTGWSVNDPARVTSVTDGADSGGGAVRLASGGSIAQTIPVEPNTRYVVTARAKVQRADTFSSSTQTDQFGTIGTVVTRISTGNRVNIGVRDAEDAVLRQAPAGTDGYSLVSVTFTTGPQDSEVTVYANTIADQAYRDSVAVYGVSEAPVAADDWQGNGSENAWVDNFDVFTLDTSYLRGADVSNLQVLEDNEGKYFANGVQQDALRILSNRGVNSITSMIFVHAGHVLYDNNLNPIKVTDPIPGGGAYPDRNKVSHDGYYDEIHTVALAERAKELGLSFMPSYHLSDGFMSASKASAPFEWLVQAYDGTLANSNIAHIRSAVYNYVHDSLIAISATGVHIVGVKQGNEQTGGMVWPVGQGATSVGHAAIIAAINDAVRAVTPEVPGYTHTDNGYSTTAAQGFFKGLRNNGAKFDGAAFSLYGGRSSANILNMAEMLNADPTMRYLDYVNVETAVSFTNYDATWAADNIINPLPQYYRRSVTGQYNWLLDYMQAPLDVPNPYGQTRGFYFWEIDWIPVAGIGSKQGVPVDVSTRTMFNNGDPAITQMGSTQPGKAGDMLDSLNAYLMRGAAKSKPASMQTPLNDPSTHAPYAVDLATATGITLGNGDISLRTGERERLRPVVSPTDRVLSDTAIAYTSSNPAVATVSNYGYVVATGAGSTTVTATVAGGASASVLVTVADPSLAQSGDLTLFRNGTALTDGQTLSVAALDTLTLTSSLADGVSDRMVVYSSSDPDVASFFGETWQTPRGELRAYSGTGNSVRLTVADAGATDITITTEDGSAAITVHLVSTKVGVTGVTLERTSAEVATGGSISLGGGVSPANATLYRLLWSSADESIATVDSSGLVRGVAEGQTTVTAVSEDNPDASATVIVTVGSVSATGISVAPTEARLQTGTVRTLRATVEPADAAGTPVEWSTSDAAVATVDGSGVVTAAGPGEATITAATTDGSNLSASTRIVVQDQPVPVTTLTLDADTHWFRSDHFADEPAADAPSHALALTVEPADATNADIVWTSDTPQVARVDDEGIVTAVAPGVALITAATRDGSVSTAATVQVPQLSESFETRGTGYVWGLTQTSSIPTMTARVTSGNGGKALVFTSRSGSGPSALQKVLAEPIRNDKVVADFTYNVGAPGSSNGAYLSLTDSDRNRYLTLRFIRGAELAFGSGGQLDQSNATALVPGMSPVGTGFNVNSAWYHVHVELDFEKDEVTFTVTARSNPGLTTTRTLPFDADTAFTGDFARMQLWTTGSGSGVWYPALDDVHVYGTEAVAKEISVEPSSVRLIPVTGTLGVSERLNASVLPATASQDLVWTSSDPDVVSVTDDGLVTATQTYDSLGQVVPATATITVAAAGAPSIAQVVPVTITETPYASEQFTVLDASGATVFPSDDSLAVASGSSVSLFANPTGGDGRTDIANIEWTSSDEEIVTVSGIDEDDATAAVDPLRQGSAVVTVRVWTYGSDIPLIARIRIDVDGGTPDDPTAPAVAGAPAALVNAADGLDLAITAEDPETGIRSLTVRLGDQEVSAVGHLDLTGLSGEQIVTATAVNWAGKIATQHWTILVVPVDDASTAPGKGTLSHTSGRSWGLHDGNYNVVMNLWWGTPGSVFRLYENGTLVSTRVLGAVNGTSQAISSDFANRPNGKYVYTAELINSRGITATTSTTVTVDAAAPGVPVLSHDNWDGDGKFTATANLWWGTNATSYAFTLDGAVVGNGDLTAASPNAQTASVSLTGVPPGTHSMTVSFTNTNGSTTSKSLTVKVTR